MDRDKVWLITGASAGIGLAVAQRVAAGGGRTVLLARGERILQLAQEIGDHCLGLQADVSDREQVEAAVAAAVERFGRIDVVVNNAGAHRGGKLARLDMDDWQQVIDTNLTGALNVAKAALPHLSAGSAIINIGAVVGFRGFPGDSAYASSKAGLSGLTRALAIELAPKDITVNLVIPGLIMTEMTGTLSDKALDALRNTIPLGRYGEPEEIAEVVEFVARCRYMTGAFIPADGGLMSSFGSVG